MKTTAIVIGLFLFIGQAYAQPSTVKWLEFHAQRYLMNEIYEISSTGIDNLRLEHIYSEDDNEFILRLSAYEFNGAKGIVINTLNLYDIARYKATTIHLTKEEFEDLNKRFSFLELNQTNKDENLIQRFNENLIFEVAYFETVEQVYYNLWIDNTTRHSFMKEVWSDTYLKFTEFFQE